MKKPLFLLVLLSVTVNPAYCEPQHTDTPIREVVPAAKQTYEGINEVFRTIWKEKGIKPYESATDLEFLRRATITILGRVPTREEVATYLKLPENARRAQACELLAKDPELYSYWATLLTYRMLDMDVPDAFLNRERESFRAWLMNELSQGVGYDKITESILTAKKFPQTHILEQSTGERIGNVRQGSSDYIPMTNRLAKTFLGTRLECAQCHNHFFDSRFNQQRYWELNSYFRQTDRGSSTERISDNPKLNPSGIIYYEDTAGETYTASSRFLDGTPLQKNSSLTRRQQLAKALVNSKDFSLAASNHVWATLFGRALNYPGTSDNVNDESPIGYPEVAKLLADEFKMSGYKITTLIRTICKTEVFGTTSVVPNKAKVQDEKSMKMGASLPKDNAHKDAVPPIANAYHFEYYPVHSMSDHQLALSLASAANIDPGISHHDFLSSILYEPNNPAPKGQHLKMAGIMKHPQMQQSLQSMAKIWSKEPADKVLDEVFSSFSGRLPRGEERQKFLSVMKKENGLEDLIWALLNSSEFQLVY